MGGNTRFKKEQFNFLFPENVQKCNEELQKTERYGPLKICLGHVNIVNNDALLLSKALSTSKQLTHFFLVDTKLVPESLDQILTGLKKSKTLYHLDLSHCGIRDSSSESICAFIRKNRTLSVLNLDHNKLRNRAATDIAESLEYNRHLSVLTLSNNNFDKSVVRPFLTALKVNRILYKLDLGDIESIRLKSALKNNELFRAVTFDTVLAKPALSKTRFGVCKVSVIGENNCGKSMFIQGLLSNNPVSKKDLRQGSVNTVNGNSGISENFPQINIRNIRTSTRLGYWEETDQHENFLTEHAMKTTHLLLMKQMKQAEKKKKASEPEETSPLKKKKSFSQSFRRKKSNPGSGESHSPKKSLSTSLSLKRSKRKKSVSDSSTDTSNSVSDSEIEEEPIKRLTMHTLASFKSMATLRKTQVSKDPSQRNNSAFSAASAFDDNEIIALGRGTVMSVSTATTTDSDSTDNGAKKQSMMQEVKLKDPRKVNSTKLTGAVIQEVNYDDSDTEAESTAISDIFVYAKDQEAMYSTNTEGEYDDVSSSKPFKKIQEKYRKLQAKQAKVDEANSKNRATLLNYNAARKKSGEDLDSNLRAFSMASRRESAYSASSSDGEDKRGTFGGRTRRKTKLVEHKSTELMRRHFSEQVFMKVKARPDGLDLSIWEMSDNNKNDAMFTGLYNTFLSQEGYGPTIVCFDLNRLVPSANNKSLGRKSLVYYLKLAKARGDAKILLVGTKLDRIKKLQKLSLINAEVKKALKEAKISRILVNSQSKLLYYPVDIVRNYGITELRKKIEKVCAKLEQVKRHLTLKDLALLDCLTANKQDEDGKLKSTIEFNEILHWSKALDIERVRVESMLKLFTRQGLIFFFPNLREIQTTILYKVQSCMEVICSLFNVEQLNKVYNNIYNSKGREDEGDVDHVNGYVRNFLISMPMVQELCGDRADPDYIIEFLKAKVLLCDWIFDPELFYKDMNMQNNIEPRFLDADVLILPTLLNDRTEINNFAKLKDKRLTDMTLANASDEILGNAEKYEVFFEAQDRTMFPSGFFASYLASFVSFLTNLKRVFDKMHNYDKASRHGLQRMNIEIYNTIGAPTVKIIVNDDFGFYVRGSRTGIRIFIHPKMKAGAFASFTFAHGMVEKVNKEILGINWSFGIRIRMKGKLKSLRKLKENVSKLQDVFSEFVGVNTFKVGKGISGIENYLRDYARR